MLQPNAPDDSGSITCAYQLCSYATARFVSFCLLLLLPAAHAHFKVPSWKPEQGEPPAQRSHQSA
eukprot:1801947-Pyramimonas_sp.AAC.1